MQQGFGRNHAFFAAVFVLQTVTRKQGRKEKQLGLSFHLSFISLQSIHHFF